MTLGEIIKRLEEADPGIVVPMGFHWPHSYRGSYDELAFQPKADITVAAMIDDCKAALGNSFEGWKGGQYMMSEDTKCHIAYRGETGEGIGPILLGYMLNEY